MNNTAKIPSYRVPTLLNGTLTLCSLRDFQGQWLVLTSMAHFGEVEAIFCDREYPTFQAHHATFLLLIQQERPFLHAWHRRVKTLHPPLLADPSRRLSRLLRLTYPLPPTQCETL